MIDSQGSELKVGDKIAYCQTDYGQGAMIYVGYIHPQKGTPKSHYVTNWPDLASVPEFYNIIPHLVQIKRIVKL